MKKFQSPVYQAIAVLIMTAIVTFLACGGFQHPKKATQTAQQKQTSKTDPLLNYPLDSFIVKYEISKGAKYITFDSSVCKYFPDFSPLTLFSNPRYRKILGEEINENYQLDSSKSELGIRSREFVFKYKGVPLDNFNGVVTRTTPNGCFHHISLLNFTPLNDPSVVRISIDEARQIALEQDYPLRAEEKWRRKMKDSLGYVPPYTGGVYEIDMVRSLYPDNVKFVWQKPNISEKDSLLYYPKGVLVYPSTIDTIKSPLVYRFNISAIGGYWGIYIDAISGQVYGKGRLEHHLTCTPSAEITHTPNFLYNYNDLAASTSINISECNFGSCNLYSLQSEHIGAFCQKGNDISVLNLNPVKTFLDWSADNLEQSPQLSVIPLELPSAHNTADGTITLVITSPVGNYTYGGYQIITDWGFVGSAIADGTNSGNELTNLSPGIYELTATNNATGCAYTEFIALGNQTGMAVNAYNITPADCFNNTGEIWLSVSEANNFGGIAPRIFIKGAIQTEGFVQPTIYETEGIGASATFEFNLSQFNSNSNPLPPGNYAILVFNSIGNKVTGLNLRIEYPNCQTARQTLQTAYWCVEHTENFFKGFAFGLGSGIAINPLLPSGISSTINGINQFTNDDKKIGIGLMDLPLYQGAFVRASSIESEPAFLFKLSIGNNPANYSIAALDVLAHEYGHGVNTMGVEVFKGVSPIISPEADAIDEGFADITGITVEATVHSNEPDIWTIAESLPPTFAKRHINNPLSDGAPSIYQGANWPTEILTEEDIYNCSRIFSYWYYLLVQGGQQTVNGVTYTVAPIGLEDAFKIVLAAFVNNSYGLIEDMNKNYQGLCAATIKAADALFPADSEGNCSSHLKQVYAAWKAVGINCPIPAGVICSVCLPDEDENDVCDNHLPYIQSVQIIDIATGNIIAFQSWELNESQTHLCLVKNFVPEQTSDLTPGLQLNVVTSESMSNLAFAGAVAPTGLLYYSGINQVSGSGTNWFFTLSSFNLSGFDSNTYYKLRFSGQDLAGNELISMHEYEGANSTPPCIAINALPYKDADGNWVDYISGYDTSFGFTYRCNLSVELFIVCDYTSTASTVYFNINITSCEDEVTWSAQMDWDGDGNFDQESLVDNSDYIGTSIVYNSTNNGQAQLTFRNIVTDEQLVLNAYCNDIPVSDDCENAPPDFDDTTFSQNPQYCLGESVCISYYVTDFSPIENVTCSVADATHTYQSGYYQVPNAPNNNGAYHWQSGTFCFTPTSTDAAQGDMVVFLSATDSGPVWCQQIGHTACIVTNLCCPTGFDYPQELQAIYDCNGDLYQPAEATVTALTNGCNLDFTLNGSTNHTLTHLGEGVYDLTVSFNNQTYQFENAITVAGIYLEDDNLEITHTSQPSLGACSSDQCNGQISLSVAGGSGYYTYYWSDDICFPDPDQMMLPCNSPFRNYLCTGSYTVTVVDDMTGCETVYTASVGLYYPVNAGVLSDNEFSVSPTVFSGSTTLTYRVGYDAQVSISMFNGQGILVDSPIQQEFRAEGQYNMTHSPPSGLPQGVYYYVLYVCEQYITRVAIKIG